MNLSVRPALSQVSEFRRSAILGATILLAPSRGRPLGRDGVTLPATKELRADRPHGTFLAHSASREKKQEVPMENA